MNRNGTFPTVPDDFGSTFGLDQVSDVKYDPLVGAWKVWGSLLTFPPGTSGCDDVFSDGIPASEFNVGSALRWARLDSPAQSLTFWNTRNFVGRSHPHAHYLPAPACGGCLREFVVFNSTDNVCYSVPYRWGTGSPFRGAEVLVRRWLDGAPQY
jgi:hypothetical protein